MKTLFAFILLTLSFASFSAANNDVSHQMGQLDVADANAAICSDLDVDEEGNLLNGQGSLGNAVGN